MSDRFGMDVLKAFPDLTGLGLDRICELCSGWLNTAEAKECGIESLTVSDQMELDFSPLLAASNQDGDVIHFPVDDLLFYLADNGLTDADVRERVKADIRQRRRRAGREVFQRFAIKVGKRRPLMVRCKTPGCANIMDTGETAPENARVGVKPFRGECPRCRQTHEYRTDDIFFIGDDGRESRPGTRDTPG